MVSTWLSLIVAVVPAIMLAQAPSPVITPIPPDPLEMVYGATQATGSPETAERR